MKRTLGLLILLAVAAHPAEESDDATALEVAIELLEREGKTEEAMRLTAMLARLPTERVDPDEANDDEQLRARVESLFNFVLAWGKVSEADIEKQEAELARYREAARKALEAGEFDAAAEATQEAAILARELEVNRMIHSGAMKRPASSSNAGLVSRLRRIEQRLDRIERLIRTRLR